MTDQRGILLGRTGAGKTAVLQHLAGQEPHAIQINPHDLALRYISGSTTLQFFTSLQVTMEPFYRFLWKHAIVVRLIKARYGIETDADRRSRWEEIKAYVARRSFYRESLAYLDQWESTFLCATEEVVKGSVRKIDEAVKARADMKLQKLVSLGAEGSSSLSREDTLELQRYGQRIINAQHNEGLARIFGALNSEILTATEVNYFVVIDHLDESWADEPIRIKLIRALMDVMREVNSQIQHAKVIMALRHDLFATVLQATIDAGFQQEKYRGLCLELAWQPAPLEALVRTRVQEHARRHQAPHQAVRASDLFTGSMGRSHQTPIAYLLERTLLRPRDAIAFVNACMNVAGERGEISPGTIRSAEHGYAAGRLTALAEEWAAPYPCLRSLILVLKARPPGFLLAELDRAALDALCLAEWEAMAAQYAVMPEDVRMLSQYARRAIGEAELRHFIAATLHRVGVVGLRADRHGPMHWATSGPDRLPDHAITDATRVQVHPMLWRVLGTPGQH
jgi:hypothetical protein